MIKLIKGVIDNINILNWKNDVFLKNIFTQLLFNNINILNTVYMNTFDCSIMASKN